MSLLIPYHRNHRQERNYSGRPTASTWGTTLTANATIHTLGTKVEMITATADEYNLLYIMFSTSANTAAITDQLCNIYIGANGVEVPFIANLLCGWAGGNSQSPITYIFPVKIPRGTRLSADMQALVTVDTVLCQIMLARGGHWAGSGVETLGALTATSRGTQVTPGTSSEGTFTSIGTTTNLWRYVLGMQGGNVNASLDQGIMALDIGTGGALINGLENFFYLNSTTEVVQNGDGYPRAVEIASGTALQARLQHHTTDAEVKSVCIYGVY